MALFLEHTLDTVKYDEVSLEEALVGVLETQAEVAELNEAILQADFILHEKTKTLTEAQALQEEESFLTRVVEKVKELIEKVKTTFSKFFTAVKEATAKFWTKLTGKEEVEMDKKQLGPVEALIARFTELKDAALADQEDLPAYKKAYVVAKAAFTAAVEGVKNAAKGGSDYVATKTSGLTKFQKVLGLAGVIGAAGVAYLNREKVSLDKAKGLIAAAKGAVDNKAKAVVEKSRFATVAVNGLSGQYNRVVSAIKALFKAKAAEAA